MGPEHREKIKQIYAQTDKILEDTLNQVQEQPNSLDENVLNPIIRENIFDENPLQDDER